MQAKQFLSDNANSAIVADMSNRLVETVPAFRVTRRVYDVIEHLKNKDRRSITDVARALLERGVAAYERDHELFEPEETPVANMPITQGATDEEQGVGNKKQGGKRGK